jgi:LysM repeat protein
VLTSPVASAAVAVPAAPPKPAVPRSALSASAVRPAVTPALSPQTVTVAAGDTLSGISASVCGSPADWTGLFAANKPPLDSPDVIEPGQVLKVHCYDPGYTAPAPPPAPPVTVHAVTHAAAAETAPAPAAYSGSGSFQQCVIARESGGDSQVMNASGHYGLYQFSEQTWVAHGGAAADFGRASVAEQNAVFAQAVADDGDSDWRPYDGCAL